MEQVGFWSSAREYPERVAVIDERGRPVTAGHLLAACNRIANKLIASGLQRGDVVATLLPSTPELMAFMLAVRQIGLYLLPLDPRARVGELKHLVQDSSPGLLVVGRTCERSDFREHVLSGFSATMEWIDSGEDMDMRLSRFLDGAPDTEPVHRAAGDILSYTSGTTGLPKAVLRKATGLAPEDVIRPLLEWYAGSFGIDSSTPGAFLSACPVFMSGPMSFATFALHLARTVVLMPQWNARLALALISQHRVSDMFLVPYQLAELVRVCRERPGRYDSGCLRAIIHGSAYCHPDIKEQALETFGEIVYECYGATEVAGTVATPREARLYKGTVGRAVAPQEIKVLDDSGLPCRPGEAGKVYMKMFPGMEFFYKGDAEGTKACQLDGFATVGDIGFLNEAGYLFLKGRSSDVINCRGQKVHPTAVEGIAAAHPRVLDAAAFGESCPESGEIVRLAVRIAPGGSAMDEVAKELFGILRKSLRNAETPRSIIIVDEIPREESGKIRRKELAVLIRRKAAFEMHDLLLDQRGRVR